MKCRALSNKKKQDDNMARLDKIIYQKTKEEIAKRTKAFDCCVLLTIHELEGYGKQRLEKFYKTFIDTYDYVCDRYEMGEAVISYLKNQTGVDIDELYSKYVKDENVKPTKDYDSEIKQRDNEIEDLQEENRILKEQVQVLMSMNNIKVG